MLELGAQSVARGGGRMAMAIVAEQKDETVFKVLFFPEEDMWIAWEHRWLEETVQFDPKQPPFRLHYDEFGLSNLSFLTIKPKP